jgi:hypothetical protein
MQRTGWILSLALWVISLGVAISLRKPECLVVAVAMQIVIVIVSAMERSSSMIQSFQDRGFQVTMWFQVTLGDSQRPQVLHYRDRQMFVRFSARGPWSERTCNYCEFVVSRGRGRGRSQIRFFELALSLKSVGAVRLVRRGLIAAALGPGDLRTSSEAVNRRWKLAAGDPEPLSRIPMSVLELMNAFDGGVTQWCVQDGWLSVTSRSTVSARTLGPRLSRLEKVAAAFESMATLPPAPVALAACPHPTA